MKTAALCILMLSLLILPCANAAFYQWTDEAGVVHMTDDPDKVPKQYRDKARRLQLPDSPPAPAAAPAPQAAPRAAAGTRRPRRELVACPLRRAEGRAEGLGGCPQAKGTTIGGTAAQEDDLSAGEGQAGGECKAGGDRCGRGAHRRGDEQDHRTRAGGVQGRGPFRVASLAFIAELLAVAGLVKLCYKKMPLF